MRGTLKSYIDEKEFTILEAGDGDEALKIIEQEIPDLILLDIKMPKKNGIEVLEILRKSHPEIKIVMETSVYEDETKKQCLDLGAIDYLKKPINKKQITDIVAKL